MDSALGKFLLLLAGSNLSHEEIYELLARMQSLPPVQLADAALRLRSCALDPGGASDSVLSDGRIRKEPDGGARDVLRRVEVLLRKEAGLTVSRAALELVDSLGKERPDVFERVKPPNREGLYSWLGKVLRHVGPSELLHHATRVRNKFVHDAGGDWPLRSR